MGASAAFVEVRSERTALDREGGAVTRPRYTAAVLAGGVKQPRDSWGGAMKQIMASVLSFLLATLSAQGAIYQWRDAEGVKHFSDKPHPAAERLELEEPPVINLPPVEEVPSLTPDKPVATPPYEHFGIVQPQPKATVRNNPGTVIVRFSIEPELRDDDHIRVLLDDRAIRTGVTAPTVALHEVYRGTHTLGAVIEDSTGKAVARAEPVTFYMHRPSVHIPANQPPRLR